MYGVVVDLRRDTGLVAAVLLSLLATMGCWTGGALASESGRIAAGGFYSCGIKADDTLVCWGSVGAIPAEVGTVDKVAAGSSHTCVIKTDDTPFCWGDDSKGQSTLPAGIGTVSQISAGTTHTCAVKTDGTPVCWGADDWGQSTLPAGIGTVSQVAAGLEHTCAVRTDGTPVCWGDDYDGRRTVPAGIGTVSQIAVGENHSCAVKTDGTPVCWGSNDMGQRTPPPGIGTVSRITAGGYQSCAIKTNSTPVCWGRTAPPGYPRPSLPAGVGAVTEITSGDWHSCALKANGSPICWGSHFAYQLGGEPTISSAPPPSLIGVGPLSHTYTVGPPPGELFVADLPTRFFVSSGSLPPGVALDGATGKISGTPTADGTYTGVVTVTNDLFLPDGTQAFSITVDTTAPAAPADLASATASPSASLKPRITGAAEAGSTVRLYDNDTCAGSPRATGSAASFASPGLQITVPADSTTTVYARATDAAGNVSPCSTSNATYVHEQPPDPPDPPNPPNPPGGGGPTPPGSDSDPDSDGSGPQRVVTRLTANTRCIGTVRRARRDLTVRYVTGQRAKLTFTLQRRIAPRLAARRACPRRLPAGNGVTAPGGKRIVYRTAAADGRKLRLTRTKGAGRHSLELLRALETDAPRPGLYRLLVRSTTAQGEPGRAASLYFWVLAPRR
jgi:hypothetical protein